MYRTHWCVYFQCPRVIPKCFLAFNPLCHNGNCTIITCLNIRNSELCPHSWYGAQGIVKPRQHSQYSHKLQAGWSGVRVLAGAKDFPLLQITQTGLGTHPTSYSIGKRLLPQVKQPTHEADCPPPSRAEVKDKWSNTFTPPIHLQDVYRDNFIFCIWLSQ
jgi:hypothetical protein